MPTLALAIKGFPVGIPKKEISVALIAGGDVNTTATVYCKRPDNVVVSQDVTIKPATYGKYDIKPVVIPDSQVIAGGAGTYEIWAQATVDTTTIESNHHFVEVKSEIETLKFSLKDPDGKPTGRSRGAIVLFHKKTGYFGVFGTDTDGNVYVPRFGVDTDWAMEVHWRHPTDPRKFDMKIYDPLDWTTVPRDFKAEGWFTEKYFKLEVSISREKFIGIITLKNPILGRYAEPSGSFVDIYPRVAATIAANELLGGIPYMDVVSAQYDSAKEVLTVHLKGYGFLWFIALVIVCLTATLITLYWSAAEIKKAQYEAEKTKAIQEGNKQYIDFLNAIREDLAAGRITESEAALLAGSASEYLSKWFPSPIPSWVWAIVIIVIVLVIAYVIVKVVPVIAEKMGKR